MIHYAQPFSIIRQETLDKITQAPNSKTENARNFRYDSSAKQIKHSGTDKTSFAFERKTIKGKHSGLIPQKLTENKVFDCVV